MAAMPAGFPLPAEKDIRRRYGLTLDDYLALAELQGWVCAVCGGPPKANRPLVVDHDHDTLTIDGLVHLMPCNRRLTQPARRYILDPPGRRLGLVVPAECEAKTIARREAGKQVARTTRAAKKAQPATQDRPSPELAQMRTMTTQPAAQPDPYQRALEESAAWSGGAVQVAPDPPADPDPEPVRERRFFRGVRLLPQRPRTGRDYFHPGGNKSASLGGLIPEGAAARARLAGGPPPSGGSRQSGGRPPRGHLHRSGDGQMEDDQEQDQKQFMVRATAKPSASAPPLGGDRLPTGVVATGHSPPDPWLGDPDCDDCRARLAEDADGTAEAREGPSERSRAAPA